MIAIDYANALPFFNETEMDQFEPQMRLAHDQLHKKTGPGSEYLGWLQLPAQYDKTEFARIRKAAQKIRRDTDILIVIGIGGSYLGARAAIELLSNNFNATLTRKERQAPLVIFAGNSISGTYLCDLFDLIADRRVSVNVISKSGTTTEPAVAFRLFKNYMEERYGREEARSRIYVTTDKSRGALKKLADEEGYETFVVPDDIGGRYSVLTAVGLLPIAAAGIDIREIMRGARDAMNTYKNPDLSEKHLLPVRGHPQYHAAQGLFRGNSRQLRAQLPLHDRMVETALRRKRRQGPPWPVPGRRRQFGRPAFDGPVHPRRQPRHVRDCDRCPEATP